MREAYLLFFNNYAGLVLSGWVYKHKVVCIAGLITYFVFICVSLVLMQFQFFYILYALLIVTGVYFIILAVSMLSWRRKSKKLGFKSLVLYPGSVFWSERMLAKRNIKIPLMDRIIEIHVNIRQKYEHWDEYNRALDSDISKIISYLNSGRFGANVTVTFNTFNRRAVDKLEAVFKGRAFRLRQVTLPDQVVYSYLPAKFKKVQKHMFGEVKSNRAVHVPEVWELLICNIVRR